MHRQLSYNKSNTNLPNSQINPALIASLQFNTAGSSNTTGSVPSPVINQPNQSFSIKQLHMNQFNLKPYDQIVNILNQQISFCFHYLTSSSASSSTDSIISPSSIKLGAQAQYASVASLNTTNRGSISQACYSHPSVSHSLFGVGLCYQLYELQQIYRHPRKIYDIAVGNQTNISPNSNISQQKSQVSSGIKPSGSSSLISPASYQYQIKFSLNDFYKNHIQPVLIPFHYCCTPSCSFRIGMIRLQTKKCLSLELRIITIRIMSRF